MEVKKERRKPVRRVFGRLRDIFVGDYRYVFELTKDGLVARRKGCRKKGAATIPFDRLTEGGGHQWKDGCATLRFSISADGVEVRRGGVRAAQLVSYAELARIANKQLEMFPV